MTVFVNLVPMWYAAPFGAIMTVTLIYGLFVSYVENDAHEAIKALLCVLTFGVASALLWPLAIIVAIVRGLRCVLAPGKWQDWKRGEE